MVDGQRWREAGRACNKAECISPGMRLQGLGQEMRVREDGSVQQTSMSGHKCIRAIGAICPGVRVRRARPFAQSSW